MRSSPNVSTTLCIFYFFFFTDTATTEIYTLSLHDALPICDQAAFHPLVEGLLCGLRRIRCAMLDAPGTQEEASKRSEEHTSELQSRRDLVCRLLLEKKKENSS